MGFDRSPAYIDPADKVWAEQLWAERWSLAAIAAECKIPVSELRKFLLIGEDK